MKRQRITITLKSEVLKALDKAVDGVNIRNRSHAAEVLLSAKLLKPKVKALILAGGREIRLPQLGREIPKALLPVNGRPLLEHMILRLKKAGVEEVIISISSGGQKIRDYFRDGHRFGVSMTYLDQTQLKKGTAQPLKQAQGQLMDSRFLLLYGDVLADIDFVDFLDFHETQKNPVATMALASAEKVSMWGQIRLVGSKIVNFEEKPKNTTSQSHLVNAGLYVMSPKIFEYLENNMLKLEAELFPRLAEEGKLSGYSFGGNWYDVSSAEVYQHVLKHWQL